MCIGSLCHAIERKKRKKERKGKRKFWRPVVERTNWLISNSFFLSASDCHMLTRTVLVLPYGNQKPRDRQGKKERISSVYIRTMISFPFFFLFSRYHIMQSVILREIAFSVSCQRPVRRQGGRRRSEKRERKKGLALQYIYIYI